MDTDHSVSQGVVKVSKYQNFFKFDSTGKILKDLTSAVNQSKLVRAITHLQDELYKIESSDGPSKKTILLRLKISNLEAQLSDMRK